MPPIIVPRSHLSFGRYFWLAWRFTLTARPSMWLVLLPMFSVVALLQGLLSGRLLVRETFSGSGLLAWLMLALLLAIPFQMWRTYHRSPLLSGFTTYAFDEAGIQVQNEVQQTQLQWSALQRVHRFGSWLLLLTGAQQGFYLDLSRVQSPHTADDVLRLLDQHGVRRK